MMLRVILPSYPVAWSFSSFYTWRECSEDLDQMKLSDLEYHVIGETLVARLLDRRHNHCGEQRGGLLWQFHSTGRNLQTVLEILRDKRLADVGICPGLKPLNYTFLAVERG
jgi:hypothetical protein